MKKIIIIGAGLAGFAVVDALRAIDKEVPITLITADKGDRYHKPMLSNAISQNKTAQDLIRADAQTAAQTSNISLLNHTQVIDIKDNQVITDKGDDLPFSHLVLAMGADPIYPEYLPDSDKIFDINHLNGFNQLQTALNGSPKTLAILGAGMVGVELAEDLAVAGHRVVLLDNNAYPLAGILPPAAGERLKATLTGLGVQFYGEKLDKVADNDGLTLTLTNGETLGVDGLIVATGLKVDKTLPSTLGLAFDDRLGILVNDDLTTNIQGVYAIGDCMAVGGRPCRFVAPHRPQATAIAQHILGLPSDYKHTTPMIRLKNKSITMQATGTPNGKADGWQVVSDEGGKLVMEQQAGGQVLATVTLTQKQG